MQRTVGQSVVKRLHTPTLAAARCSLIVEENGRGHAKENTLRPETSTEEAKTQIFIEHTVGTRHTPQYPISSVELLRRIR